MLDEARGEESVQNRVHVIGGRRVDVVRPGYGGRAVRRNRNLEGKQGSGAEVCSRLRQHVRELGQDFTQLEHDDEGATRTVRIKRDFAHVWRQVVPRLYEARELVIAQSFEQGR